LDGEEVLVCTETQPSGVYAEVHVHRGGKSWHLHRVDLLDSSETGSPATDIAAKVLAHGARDITDDLVLGVSATALGVVYIRDGSNLLGPWLVNAGEKITLATAKKLTIESIMVGSREVAFDGSRHSVWFRS
jgi:hypothetical protein